MRHHNIFIGFLSLFYLAGCASITSTGSESSVMQSAVSSSSVSVQTEKESEEKFLTIDYPLEKDMTEVRSLRKFSLRGEAMSSVAFIEVTSSCDQSRHRLTSFQRGDTSWRYTVAVELGNLCKTYSLDTEGLNEFQVTAFDDENNPLSSLQVTIRSDVGLVNPEQFTVMQSLKKLMKGTSPAVENDPSIIYRLYDKQQYDNYCALFVESGDSFPRKTVTRPTFFGGVTDIGNGLYVRVRTGLLEDHVSISPFYDRELLGSRDGKEFIDSPTLVFYERQGDRYVVRKDIPTITNADCPFTYGFTVYSIRPDRIWVDIIGGHETGNMSYLFDGKKWTSIYSILKSQVTFPDDLWTPLAVKTDKHTFSIMETSYCCDRVMSKYPGKWSEFIFDIDTLKIVDVVLHENIGRR